MRRTLGSIAAACLVAACSAQAPGGATPTAANSQTARATNPSTAAPTPTQRPSPTIRAVGTIVPLDATFQPEASARTGAIPVQMGTCCRLAFVPTEITAKAGDVSLFLTNFPNNAFPFDHDLKIGHELGREIASSPRMKNGETGTLTIENMPAGEYVFWCAVEQHYQNGMVGTLTVTP